MRLITELTDTVEYVTEAREGKSPDHFITGRFMVAEEKNKNGRIYPLHVLKPEVERYVTEMVKTGRSLGECGHPSGPTVNLERASHLITELKQNGNGFDGKAKLVNTPMGNIVKGLLESGAKIGVSTRGMGSLKENNGAMEVQKDFKLSSIDCVSDPSGPGCFVNGILEGVEYFYDDARGTWKEEKIVEMKETMHKMSIAQLEENALAIFEDYLEFLVLGEDKRDKWLNAVQRKVDTGRQTTKGTSSSLVKSTGKLKPLIKMGKAERDKTMNTTISGEVK